MGIVFLSGVCFSFAVQAYPFWLASLPGFIWLALALKERAVRFEKESLASYAVWAAGALAVVVCFIALVVWLSSLRNLITNLPFLLSDPNHGEKTIPFIQSYAVYIQNLLGPVRMGLYGVALVALVVYSFTAKRCSSLVGNVLWGGVGLIGLDVTRLVFATYSGSMLYVAIEILCLLGLVLGPFVFFLCGRRFTWAIPVFAIGVLASLGVESGTNNGFVVSSYPLVISSIGIMLHVGLVKGEIETTSQPGRKLDSLGYVVFTACLAVFVMGVVFVRWNGVYRDAPLDELSVAIEQGPAAGLHTTPESKKAYDEVISIVSMHAPSKGTILFSRCLPAGYLLTDLRPGAPTVFDGRLSSPRLSEYYRMFPELEPFVVFVFSDSLGSGNEDNPFEGTFAERLESPAYEKVEYPDMLVYTRVGC